jgi:hypothetical protein
MTVKNQNCSQKEIESRLNLWSAYHSEIQNLLSFHLLPGIIKIKAYEAVILLEGYSLLGCDAV